MNPRANINLYLLLFLFQVSHLACDETDEPGANQPDDMNIEIPAELIDRLVAEPDTAVLGAEILIKGLFIDDEYCGVTSRIDSINWHIEGVGPIEINRFHPNVSFTEPGSYAASLRIGTLDNETDSLYQEDLILVLDSSKLTGNSAIFEGEFILNPKIFATKVGHGLITHITHPWAFRSGLFQNLPSLEVFTENHITGTYWSGTSANFGYAEGEGSFTISSSTSTVQEIIISGNYLFESNVGTFQDIKVPKSSDSGCLLTQYNNRYFYYKETNGELRIDGYGFRYEGDLLKNIGNDYVPHYLPSKFFGGTFINHNELDQVTSIHYFVPNDDDCAGKCQGLNKIETFYEYDELGRISKIAQSSVFYDQRGNAYFVDPTTESFYDQNPNPFFSMPIPPAIRFHFFGLAGISPNNRTVVILNTGISENISYVYNDLGYPIHTVSTASAESTYGYNNCL